jgi:hypothetical protein
MRAALDVPHVHDLTRGPALTAALRKVGASVLNRGDEGLIAVLTLHRHFDIPKGWTLLDRVNVTAQEIVTGLVTVAEANAHQPIVWAFTPDGEKVVLGWSDTVATDGRLTSAVDEAGACLVREGLTTTLAIARRQSPLAVGPNEILLEQTDEAACTQRVSVTPRSRVSDELTAAWYFTCDPALARGNIRPEDVQLMPLRGCDPGC